MSRLDSFIRRLEAQRACLDAAAAMIAGVAGSVLELGLGNGRTYDHLRARLPGREIFAFDRQVAAHPDCIPDEAHLVLGDFRETLLGFPHRAALIHADIGSGDVEATALLAAAIAPLLGPLLEPGGLVVSDQVLDIPRTTQIYLPAGVPAGRYLMRRRDP